MPKAGEKKNEAWASLQRMIYAKVRDRDLAERIIVKLMIADVPNKLCIDDLGNVEDALMLCLEAAPAPKELA